MPNWLIDLFSIIGSIGTLAAVIVALWQTKLPLKIRLKSNIKLIDRCYQSSSNKFIKYKEIYIEIDNIGYADCSILYWGIQIDKYSFFNLKHYGSKPKPLNRGTNIWIWLPLEYLVDPVKFYKKVYKFRKIELFLSLSNGKRKVFRLPITTYYLSNLGCKDCTSEISEEEYVGDVDRECAFHEIMDYLIDKDFK